MQLKLCSQPDWDDLPRKNEITHMKYCNTVWQDGVEIHICADYANHVNGHSCYCTRYLEE